MIPIFDSLAHPTLTGTWPNRERDATVETLVAAMAASGFAAACAVGLAGVGAYEHERFAAMCQPYPNLISIAGFDPLASAGIADELERIIALGYRGIKLHPRLSAFSYREPKFIETLAHADAHRLPVFVCTYFHCATASYPAADPLFDLAAALKTVPNLRVMLVHGGDIELMRYVQLARHNPNLLIDLSYTFMKYPGSSLDLDIRHLFTHYCRRVCIGVDHPEFNHAGVRARFDDFCRGVDDDDARNVAYRNLAGFLEADIERWL